MGAERRRHRRARCSIPCELITDGSSVVGEVRNISAGGLGLLAEGPPLEQGDPVGVVLRVPGTRSFEISALVWHVRAARRSGKPTRSFGLVLGEASPPFAQLVEKLTGGERAAGSAAPSAPIPPRAASPRKATTPPAAPAAPPEPPRAAPPATPALRQFAVRIRQIGGPRTCRVIACGANESEAAEAALAEVGSGWALLDSRAL